MAGFKGTYLGHEIEIPPEECYAVSVMKWYGKLGLDVIKHYEELYHGYQDFRTFADRGIRDGYTMLDNCLQRTADKLVHSGHYDVNRETLLARYEDQIYRPWFDLEDLIDKVLQLGDQQIEQSQEYREIRKARRGRVVGGGFGLKAAVGGMAAAGALNALSGIVHSGANAVGNARTRASVTRQLNDLYQNGLLESVQGALYECISNMGLTVLSYQGCLKTEYVMGGTQADLARAKALKENYQKVPQDKRPDIAVEILKLNPLNIDTYEQLLQEYKDPDGTLMALANALSLKEDYDKILRKTVEQELSGFTRLLREKIQSFADDRSFNISKLDTLKSESQQQAQSIFAAYGIKDGHLDVQQKFSSQIDEIFTSVFHQIIDHRIGEELQQLSGDIYGLKIEELDAPIVQQLINDTQEKERAIFKALGIEESHSDLLRQYCSKAEKVVSETIRDRKERDLKNRTFREKTYATVTQAERAKQLWNTFTAVYEGIGPHLNSDQIGAALEKLISLEQQAPEELLEEMQTHIQEVRQIRDEADRLERTFLDVTFDTREERVEAEKQYHVLRQEIQPALAESSINSLVSLRESLGKREDICAPIKKTFLDAIERKEQMLEQQQAAEALQKRNDTIAVILLAANIGYLIFTVWSLLTQNLFSTISGEKMCAFDLFRIAISDSPNIPDSVKGISTGVILILIGMARTVYRVLNHDEDLCQIPIWVLLSALSMWGLIAWLSTSYVVTNAYFVLLAVSLIFAILDSKLDKIS